ncbi:Hsp20/alpha crystallin family protein [bacterium]|nr:Hsp20/alpha crystallin family protein [bacterium]
MTLIRINPLRDMMHMQNEMNRLFDHWFDSNSDLPDQPVMWSPIVDISETDNEIVMVAEMPGMKKEDIRISLQDNVLSLSGEKVQDKEDRKLRYHRLERGYGQFQRSFVLPTSVKGDDVRAEYKNGLLTIHLAKTEAAKPRQIDIGVK